MHLTFVVDVDHTDRTRADGAFVVDTHTVTVLADTDADATLTAAQMVAARTTGMVTATRIVDILA